MVGEVFKRHRAAHRTWLLLAKCMLTQYLVSFNTSGPSKKSESVSKVLLNIVYFIVIVQLFNPKNYTRLTTHKQEI